MKKNQKLLINDERTRLEAGETITIGSKQISLGANELSDLDKLKVSLEKRKLSDLVDLNQLYDALDSSNSININLNDNEIVSIINSIRDDVVIKYNDNNYKLIMNWDDEDNPVINEVSELTLADEIFTLGEWITNVDENSDIFEYNNKLYTIGINEDDGNFEIISQQDLEYYLVSGGSWLRLESNWVNGGTMTHDIVDEYNPIIKIEGVSQEIDLKPYIVETGDNDDKLKIINLLANDNGLSEYDGKKATITLIINGKEIKWTGTIVTVEDVGC